MNGDSGRNYLLTRIREAAGRERWLLAILAGQVLLNVGFLGRRVLWLDEAYSALTARLPLNHVASALRFDAGPPLYYWMLHGWCWVLGESEVSLRGFSLLFALVASVFVYWLASVAWDRRAAVFSTFVFAFSLPVTAYSHEARNYTLFAALCCAYAIGLMLFLFREQWKWLALASLALTGMVYTHNVGWFVALAGGAVSLFFIRDRKRKMQAGSLHHNGLAVSLFFIWDRKQFFQLIGGMALAVLLYLPWVPVLMEQMGNTELTIGWVANAWTTKAILHSVIAFMPGGSSPVYVGLPAWPSQAQAVNAALWLLPIAWVLTTCFKEKRKETVFVLGLAVLGLLGPYLYSFILTPVYLAGRTDFCVFPFWCLLTGLGIARLPRAKLRWGIMLIFLTQAVYLNGVFLIRDDPRSERDIVTYLSTRGRSGDVVLCTGLTRPSLEYYLKPEGFQFASFPRDMERHLAHFNEGWYIKNVDLKLEAKAALSEALERCSTNGQLWIAGSERPINRSLFDVIHDETGTLMSNRIQTPRMGLRKLNEPVFLLKIRQ